MNDTIIPHGSSGVPTLVMAQLHLPPPDPFNFRNPDDWPRWKRRFEQYRVAAGLTDDSARKQVNTLLYCLGEEAEAVLNSTNPSAEDKEVYATVLGKFDGFFQVRKNVIFERARFNKRNQQEGESAEKYIMALYDLLANCDYGEMTSEMLRDRLVVGIRDQSLSAKLQTDSELTLEKAKKQIRQREAVHEQQQELKGNEPSSADAIRRSGRQNFRPQRQSGGRNAQRKFVPPTAKKCMRCGKESHPREQCPAKDAECHRCKRKGHYGAVCRSKTVTGAMEAEDVAFLDNVSPGKQETIWLATVDLNGKQTPFKLDTGAEVTAISDGTHERLGKPTLDRTDKLLYGPSRQLLQVLGMFTGTFNHKGIQTQQPVYVVKSLRRNLLGLPAITSLKLAARMDAAGEDLRNEFPNVFNGLGNLGEEYSIKLKPDATPYALYTPRNVAMPLRPQVDKELKRMESMGVISKVDEPTPWCAGMVVVRKKNGNVRICVDLKPLNESVLREVHPLPKVDETLAQLSGARVFSKLDANSGFWQIPLEKSSRLLTTFITPFGRYYFNKLPFGISSAPEHFQKRMSAILSGLEGQVCQTDDILVFGRDQAEHDRCLRAVLRRIESAGATLNPEKCEFSRSEVKFLGHIVDGNGIRADPEKTSAIRDMKPPENVSELRRFMGMVNQLGKFSPELATLTQPLRELLSKKNAWTWGPSQDQAFTRVKEELSQPTVLTLYNPEKESFASAYGLGAVLLQNTESDWKPVAYASRSMSETERRYAQIEKEALATTWACEKFSMYVLGKRFLIETDHKPLVPLLGSKHLDSLPPRVLRFRLRLDRFDYSIEHVPGKLLYTADTLSRAPVSSSEDSTLEELAELAMDATIAHLPASRDRLLEYTEGQTSDPLCSLVIKYCRTEWPGKKQVNEALAPYWEARGNLTLRGNLLLHVNRNVVPAAMQRETLNKLHKGHQGIERCRLRARMSVWWPGISHQIEQMVKHCSHCTRETTPRKEPLMPTALPEYPWQKIGTDLFSLNGSNYLLAADYFSRFPEVIKLTSTTSASIISALKSIFSRYGIPEEVVSDNGPQYSSHEFRDFAKEYNFNHTTSSPHFPQSNGHAERAVQTAKKLLKGSDDLYLSLLSYRSTPLTWCGLSPAELLMGRQIRSNLPQTSDAFKPQWPYLSDFRQSNRKLKAKQKANYDSRHGTRPLAEIPDDTPVWVTTDGSHVVCCFSIEQRVRHSFIPSWGAERLFLGRYLGICKSRELSIAVLSHLNNFTG